MPEGAFSMTNQTLPPPARRGRDRRRLTNIDRFCRLFTEIHPGEGKTGLLMAFNIMLILVAYYMVKPMREGWISMESLEGFTKMEIKAYSSFAQSLLLLWVVRTYGRMVSSFPRGELIRQTTLFCLFNLFVFWLIQPNFFVGFVPGLGFLFYLWVGMFGVFMVAQTWTFVIDLYDREMGNRVIPLVAVGGTLGAVVGSWLVKVLMTVPFLGANALLLLACIPLTGSWLLCRHVDFDTRYRSKAEGILLSTPDVAASEECASSEAQAAPPQKAPLTRNDVFGLLLGNRFILWVALSTLLMNWVNTNGENLLYRVINELFLKASLAQDMTDSALQADFIKNQTVAFYGQFFFWVNVLALTLQAFVASRLLKYGGFAAIILLLPVLVLGSSLVIVLFPSLLAIKIMKITENATDYSINNTARHILWLPMSAEVKFKAKTTIDSLLARLGDGLAAVTVLIGVNFLALSVQGYFGVNVVLILLWLWFTIRIVMEHRRLPKPVGS